MKTSKKIIKEIEELSKEGMSFDKMAKKLKVPYSVIYYYMNRMKRIKQVKDNFNKKSLKEKRELYKNKSPYYKIWFYKKYHNDSVFRKKHIERVKLNRKKRNEFNNIRKR
jgi:hypothetical protein